MEEASIGEVLVSILVQFEIGEFESRKESRHEPRTYQPI